MRTILLTFLEMLVLGVLACGLSLGINALRGESRLDPFQDVDQARQAQIEAQYQSGGAVTLEEAKELLASDLVLFLDARTQADYEAGHIPGALNLPFDPFADPSEAIAGLPQEGLLIVYCSDADCTKAQELAEYIRYDGRDLVVTMPEGWQGWTEKGFSVEQGPGEDS